MAEIPFAGTSTITPPPTTAWSERPGRVGSLLSSSSSQPSSSHPSSSIQGPAPVAAAAFLAQTRAHLAAVRVEGLVTGQIAAIHRIRAAGWLMTRPPAARLVMTQAHESANLLGHPNTDARHILLCLLTGDARIPGRLLATLDLALAQVRLHLMDRLMGTAATPSSDAATTAIREIAIGLGQLDAILRLAGKGLLSVGAMRMEVGDLVVAGLVSRGQVRSLLDGPDDTPITNPRLPVLQAS